MLHVQFIKKNPTRCNNVPNFIIPYLYKAQHVSVLHLFGFVPDNVHQLHVQQPTTYEKPEAASAVLGS
jgi:hypothetical protein